MIALFGFFITGWLATFWPTIQSAFDLMQTDPGDTRLVNLLLEHSWLWVHQAPGLGGGNESLWDLPFFHPRPHTLAFAESMLGLAPLYWFFRFVGFEMDTAHQLWLMGIVSANYWVMSGLLSVGLKLDVKASALGAYLFAFGSPRIAQLGHQQLIGELYAVTAVWALTAGLRSQKTWPFFPIAALVLGLQFYAGVTQGWFFGLFLFLITLFAILDSKSRATFHFLFRDWRNLVALAVSAILFVFVLSPLISHYSREAQDGGFLRNPEWILRGMPPLKAWFYHGPWSLLFSWQESLDFFRSIPERHEQRIGMGLLTPVLAMLGLWQARFRPFAWIALLASAIVVILITRLPGLPPLWPQLLHWIPGGEAIRNASRFAILLLWPASLGIALYASRIRFRWLLLVFALVFLEQTQVSTAFEKKSLRMNVQSLAEIVSVSQCTSFLYSPEQGDHVILTDQSHFDAMGAALLTGVPTLNGYSGKVPPGWHFSWSWPEKKSEEARRHLIEWAHEWKINQETLCWIRSIGASREDHLRWRLPDVQSLGGPLEKGNRKPN